MATCVKYQTVWVPVIDAATPRQQFSMLIADASTPVNACNTLLVNASEYSQLSHGYITTAEDANAIAFSLVVLLAIGFGIKMIRRSLDAAETSLDEKH